MSYENPVSLTAEKVAEARKQLTPAEAAELDQLVKSAAHPATFYKPGPEERQEQQQILEKAFPEEDVTHFDIRQWAKENPVEEDDTTGTGEP